jgi:hypothetical protein
MPAWTWAPWGLAAALLAGCAVPEVPTFTAPPPPVYLSERFDAESAHAQRYGRSAEDVCEGARRALLSQGYVLSRNDRVVLVGSKFFQPEKDRHVELKLQVTCVPDDAADRAASAYVTAWEDQYVVKKSTSSSSLGVSAIGSISLPMGSSEDSLVKVGVQTVRAPAFYDRFHRLIAQLLPPPR